MRKPIVAGFVALGLAGCGGSSAPAIINVAAKAKQTAGIQGHIVSLSGTLVTVRGQLLHGAAGNASGSTVTRKVRLWASAAKGMKPGDQVYFSTGRAGGFSQDKTRDARNARATAAGQAAAQSAVNKFKTCLKADTDYGQLAKDFDAAIKAIGSSTAINSFGEVVADVDTYETDLALLRPRANASQQAQIVQYDGVLDSTKTGAQDAAAGNEQAAVAAWTGVAQQVGSIPKLVNALCGV